LAIQLAYNVVFLPVQVYNNWRYWYVIISLGVLMKVRVY